MKVAVVFGRFNPPTRGHSLLLEELDRYTQKGYEAVLGLSHSENAPVDYRRAYRKIADVADPEERAQILASELRNPLSYEEKRNFVEQIIDQKGFSITIADESIRTLPDLFINLATSNKKNILLLAGSDRVPDFKELIERYNNSQPPGYQVNADVKSVGERDPDADDIEGMSATKLRFFAALEDFDSFSTGVDTDNRDLAWDLYQAVLNKMDIPKEFRTVGRAKKKDAPIEEGVSDYLTQSLYGLL
jgi:nicotinic acid mononucleotide adenylyltransferase